MRALSSSLVVIALLSSCAHTSGLLITGHSLNMVGEQFVVVASYMDEAVKQDQVTHDQYQKWAEFGTKFQAAYPAAVHLYKVAVITNDKILEQKAIDALNALIPELLRFAAEVGVTIEALQQ